MPCFSLYAYPKTKLIGQVTGEKYEILKSRGIMKKNASKSTKLDFGEV